MESRAGATPEASHFWYLIRTKPGKERWVRDQLVELVPETFLPMLKAQVPRWGRLAWSTAPLFPCYLFARLSLREHYFDVKYMAGVQGLVCAGMEPVLVEAEVVESIRVRAVGGVVEIRPRPFVTGERLRITTGPFRDFEAIFERYLSGEERVAILLNAVGAGGIRVVTDASSLAR